MISRSPASRSESSPGAGQRSRLVAKYSQEDEFAFWQAFSGKGLLPMEARALAAWLPPNASVLDAGCGGGREALALCSAGHRVYALDVVPKMVRATARRLAEAGVSARLAVGDICDGIPFDVRFDAVTLFEQVYHQIPGTADRQRALCHLRASLAPHGRLFMTVFNEGDVSLVSRLRWLKGTKWRLAAAMALDHHNPVDARYAMDPEANRDPARRTLADRLRIGRWTAAYLWNLAKRKAALRFRRLARRTPGADGECKRICHTTPFTASAGWFWFPVLSLREVERELAAAGFDVIDVFPVLEPAERLDPCASRGAPQCLVVARPCGPKPRP